MKRKHSYRTFGNERKVQISRTDIDFQYLKTMPAFFPFTVEKSVRYGHFAFQEEYSFYALLIMLEDGELLYQCNGKTILLKPGMVLFIPSGATYSFSTTSSAFYQKNVVEFGGKEIVSVCNLLEINHFSAFTPDDSLSYLRAVEALREIMGKKDAALPKILSHAFELLVMFSIQSREAQTKSSLWERAKYLLGSDLEKKLLLPDAAKSLKISLSSLNRLFQTNLGEPPLKYRNICRLNAAKDLLRHSNLSIKEIAEKVGFCNQFYFSSEFQRYIGESPSNYRRHFVKDLANE
jgi:AraC-like DNA-binding protein